MTTATRTGTKRDHRGRKNGASREQYLRKNREENEARGPQEIGEFRTEIGNSKVTKIKRWRE